MFYLSQMVTIISTLIWLEAAPENMKFLVNPLLARWLRKVMNDWEKNGLLQNPNNKYETSQKDTQICCWKKEKRV